MSYGKTVAVRCLCLVWGIFWVIFILQASASIEKGASFAGGVGAGIGGFLFAIVTLLFLFVPLDNEEKAK